jgi:methionyl aminopeptidase
MTKGNFIRRSFKPSLKEGAFPFGPPFLVPGSIPRPHRRGITEFAQKLERNDVDKARESARIAASALLYARSLTKPGNTTEFIDTQISQYIVDRKAFPSGIGFMGFPKAICQSVNEIIAHGIPDSRPLRDGDIVNFDITAYKDGFYGDNSDTFLVGTVDQAGRNLVEATKEALNAAIHICRPGQRFSAIANEITRIAKRGGYGVVDYFCGHFIGREMHIAPNIQHSSTGSFACDSGDYKNLRMEPMMLFTIEPILTEGSTEGEVWNDGWTYVTKDRGRTAQAEHMVLITDSGHEILTIPDETSF